MSYQVTVYIDYPNNDYEHLTQRFHNNDISLSYDHDHLEQLYGVIFSNHIESLNNIDKIARRLFSLQTLLTGARFIELGHETHRRIQFDKFKLEGHNMLPDGIHKVHADSIEEYPFEGTEEENQKKPNIYLPADLDSVLFSVSKIDYIIRNLLFQAGMIRTYKSSDKILTWNTLYKIADTVKFGCGEIGIKIEDLIDNSDINRFTSACNNALVLGINARHGLNKKNKIPKKQPITDINQAVDLILCLAKKFAIQYITSKQYVIVNDASQDKCKAIETTQVQIQNDLSRFDEEQ